MTTLPPLDAIAIARRTKLTKQVEMQPLTSVESEESQNYDQFVDEIVARSCNDRIFSWEDFLYPPNVPRECQLLRMENIAIPACYFMVGILQGLSGPFMNAYPRDIHATEAQQTIISGVRSLPASCKLFFGFLSDTVPLCGKRRKSYMAIGWSVASIAVLWLYMTSDLTLDDLDEDGKTPIPPEDAPSIPKLATSLLLFGTGFWMADVMGDSLVAEKAKLEPPECRGGIQSSCYAYRFFGLMVAAPCSTLLYKTTGPQSIILCLAALPLTMLPFIWILREKDVFVASNDTNTIANDDNDMNSMAVSSSSSKEGDAANSATTIPSVQRQCKEIWSTVCSRAVWQPMGFVYLYNLLQVGNSAWREFLVTGLGFSSFQLNILYNVSVVLLYVGVVAYKYYFISWSWRTIYIVCTLFNGIFSLLQLLLIEGTTFGIPPFWFALGDDVFAEFLSGIQFLPTTIMMVHLCPVGSEGASYAMFTTVNNSALSLSSAISAQLLSIWDVSKTAIEEGRYEGMTKLTIFTTIVQVSAIAFVGLLPNTKEDLYALRDKTNGSSKVGGAIFLIVTFLSLVYAIRVGVLAIVAPGSLGES